jgi:RimJ/RimL family protein N-acetyltransferase
MVDVRRAVADDAEGVARVHVASWQAGYADLLPADYLDGLRWQGRFESWSARLSEPAAAGRGTWVLTSAGEVVGFASIGPARDEDRQSSGAWELYGIYLRSDHWGHGHGTTLAEAAFHDIPDQAADVSLWVLADNERARRFYERLGFVADGHQRVETIGGRELAEVRYLRRSGT